MAESSGSRDPTFLTRRPENYSTTQGAPIGASRARNSLWHVPIPTLRVLPLYQENAYKDIQICTSTCYFDQISTLPCCLLSFVLCYEFLEWAEEGRVVNFHFLDVILTYAGRNCIFKMFAAWSCWTKWTIEWDIGAWRCTYSYTRLLLSKSSQWNGVCNLMLSCMLSSLPCFQL